VILISLICLAGAIYCAVALVAISRFAAERPKAESGRREGCSGVTILKPIHGLEAELFENLSSFCDQEDPVYQVLFGVRRSDDPAIEVANRVIARFPDRDLALVIDDRPFAGNPKVANLASMMEHAKYDLIAIADADMRVDRAYLGSIRAEFADARVGGATCLYRGSPRGGLASQLGALHFNDQFAPSVLVATLAGPPRFCMGSTMAVRRDALEAIGGINALAPYLADDYMLGKLLSERGYRIALSRYVVESIVSEPGVGTLAQHELRWARTIRSVQTAGYIFSFVTYPLPFALLWAALRPGDLVAWFALIAIAGLRVTIHDAMQKALAIPDELPVWLLPLRDCLSLGVWAAGLFGNRVNWRNQTMHTK